MSGHLETNLIPFEPILAHFKVSEHDNGLILRPISPLFLVQKGLNAPQIMYSGTGKKTQFLGVPSVYFWGHLVLDSANLESLYQDLRHYGDFFLASSWTFSVL